MIIVALPTLAAVTTPATVGTEDAFVNYLRPVVHFVGGVVRVYYAATCSSDTKDQLGQPRFSFPEMQLQPPSREATGITAVRQIFRDDPSISVTVDRSGVLRITIGSVPTEILQTRIQALALDPAEQYNAPAAVLAVKDAPEVYAARRKLHLAMPWGTRDIIVGGPVPGAPHLPRLIRNVTVDEALDSVAATFKGIVLYGACTLPDNTGLFFLDFKAGS